MAKDPLLPNAPGEGDSWESLASNLLGVNLNKPLDAESVSAEELEALELDVDEPLVEQPASLPEFDEAAAAGEEDEPEHRDEPAAATTGFDRASDPYWDPLAEWEWDEQPSSKRPSRREPAEGRGAKRERQPPAIAKTGEKTGDESILKGPGADARRAADSFDTVSDYRDEYESGDDWAFGAGLLEGVAPPEPAKPERVEAKPEAKAVSEPPPESKPPRREREQEREREPRRREERPESREKQRPPAEKRERREPAPPAKVAPRPSSEAAAEEDAFGAGLLETRPAQVEQDAGEEREERRPRRRRRRRSSKSEPRAEAAESPEATDSTARVAELQQDFDEPDEEPADDDRPDSPYRNIPSWEEAISYLTKRRPAESGAASGAASGSSERNESTSRSESGRSSGGGRRRRRRPSR